MFTNVMHLSGYVASPRQPLDGFPCEQWSGCPEVILIYHSLSCRHLGRISSIRATAITDTAASHATLQPVWQPWQRCTRLSGMISIKTQPKYAPVTLQFDMAVVSYSKTFFYTSSAKQTHFVNTASAKYNFTCNSRKNPPSYYRSLQFIQRPVISYLLDVIIPSIYYKLASKLIKFKQSLNLLHLSRYLLGACCNLRDINNIAVVYVTGVCIIYISHKQ
jgi:hypothetical protein